MNDLIAVVLGYMLENKTKLFNSYQLLKWYTKPVKVNAYATKIMNYSHSEFDNISNLGINS